MFVMAEFLWRGWNVAIPEVDVGDDVFVVRDADGTLYRIQVKTACGTKRSYGFSAQFNVGKHQLQTPRVPDLTYVFTTRLDDQWGPVVVFGRKELYDLHVTHSCGSAIANSIIFSFTYSTTSDRAFAGKWGGPVDVSTHINEWSRWPRIND